MDLINIYFDEKNSILHCTWQEATRKAEWNQMMEGMFFYGEALKKFKPKYVLIDERTLFYTWIPDNQIWVNENIVPISIEVGIQKHAFVLNADIFITVALQQLMNEKNARNLERQFFETPKQAENWLLKG